MIETKQIRIPLIIYEKMTKRKGFNESYGDFIDRSMTMNDVFLNTMRGLYKAMQKMWKCN